MSAFAATVNNNYFPEWNGNVMDELFKQYERVVIESLITSFGLDALIKDQYGGDVDTIYNVRKYGEDPKITYKNNQNFIDYENRGAYNYDLYHDKNPNYQRMKRETRKNFEATGKPIKDAYTGRNLYFYSRSARCNNGEKQASIDHVNSAHTIHNDRGRVLSGLSGEELANANDNLVFTNASLNSSMGATKENGEVVDIPRYIQLNSDLPENEKNKMTEEYKRANKAYEAKIAHSYYTSPKFWNDTAKMAGNRAVQMGVRQACGFIFTEIWFSVRDELSGMGKPFEFAVALKRIGEGVRQGFENAKIKYKDLIEKFADGAFAGAMASLATTISNIFFTTAENVVRIIRETWVSLVEAIKILFINPDNLLFGERLRATSKIIATGASVVAGVLVSEALEGTPVGAIPVVGEIITTFCGTLVTGIMSCSLLYFLDNSELANKLVSFFDGIPSISAEVNYFIKQAKLFEEYAAELLKIDIQKFKREVEIYEDAVKKINDKMSEEELNLFLKATFENLDIKLPWKSSFSEFMDNSENRLVFE